MKYSKKWTSLFLASALTLSTVSIATPQVQAEEVKNQQMLLCL